MTIALDGLRLVLRPLPAAAAAALPGDRREAAAMLGAILPAAWPQRDLLDVLPMQAAAGPGEERFGIWIIIERETNAVVGDIGFMGPPERGVVELGFSVVPEHRRRGFAIEAARLIMDWALQEPGVEQVIARCDADNEASIAVLDHAGFSRTREDGGRIEWRISPAT
jgi:[ribosomal protein S5]-alanine N-acetyltransferase